MKINFQQIITNSGQPLTKTQLAKEMVAKGMFDNHTSAYQIMQRYERGESGSVSFALLEFLMDRFNLTTNQILLR